MKWAMIMCILVAAILLPASAYAASKDKEPPAQQGVIDLSGQPLGQRIVQLEGEWAFYWNKLLTPDDITHTLTSQSASYIQAPSIWSKAIDSGTPPLSNQGYGTYRLRVMLSPQDTGEILSLYVPSIASAYRLWINGEPMLGNGTVGTDRQSMQPKSYSRIVSFKPINSEVDIVLQVSNFSQRKGGMWAPLSFGHDDPVRELREGNVTREIFLASIVFILGYYHITLFFFRVRGVLPLFLGLFCFLLSLRVLLVGELLLIDFIPSIPWELSVKLEYLAAYLGLMLLFLLLAYLYPHEMNKRVVTFTVVVCVTFSLSTLFPAIIYTYLLMPFQLFIVPVMAYAMYVIFLAAWHKREGAYINCASIFILLLTIYNDIFYYNFWIQTPELSPFGVVIFLFAQTIIVAKKNSNAFTRAEHLGRELHQANQSLEEKVAERTRDLQASNEQLRHIEQTRKTFFSTIAHELGTPMQSVQGYIQLAEAETKPHEQKHYLQIAYDKTRLVSRLIKELLDLAKMEENQFEFIMEETDAESLLDYLFKRFCADIERGGLVAKSSPLQGVPAGYKAALTIDTMRMEQVFSNLVNNAIKFTPAGGRIHLQGEFVRTLKGSAVSDKIVPGQTEADRIVSDLDLAATELHGWILLKVTDTGAGIDKDLLPHIFDRFTKGKSLANIVKGSGLGLSICKNIVLKHNGTIQATSEFGQGSCFTISLPATLQPEENRDERENLDR